MATRYWVGGSGTWDASSTANWSASSGGAAGASAPVAADAVIFDGSSGAGICTTASGSTCASVTLNSSTLGLTLGANHAMSGAFTLTLGNLSLGSSTLTCSSFSSSNSNTRSIAFGTGNITVTTNNGNVWAMGVLTGFTYTGAPVVNFTYSGSVGTRTIQHGQSSGGSESNAVNFYVKSGTDTVTITGTTRVKTLDFTGFAGTLSNTSTFLCYGDFVLGSGMTVAANTGTSYMSASSGVQKITTNGVIINFKLSCGYLGTESATLRLQDNLTLGSTYQFTLTSGALDLTNNSTSNYTLSAGTFGTSYSNTRSILFGTGSIELTSNNTNIWTGGNVTNFSYTGTPNINCTYSGSTGTRVINAGTTNATETNSLNFNVTAGTDTVTIANSSNIKNLNFTGFAGTLLNNTRTIYGDLTIANGMTCTAGASAITFAATSGTQKITTNAVTLDFPFTFNGIGGTFAFQDALTQGSTRAFSITNGTVQLKAGVTSAVGEFVTSGTNQKYLQSTLAGTQATLSQTSGTVNVSYLTIQDINATGGATWNAYTTNNNVNAGNNLGWDFSSQIGKYIYTRRKNKRILP